MTVSKIAASLALAGLLVAPSAFAQSTLVEIDDAVAIPGLSMTADALDDMDVHDAAGTKIGEVEEVLGTDKQTPTAVSVDFDDRALAGDDDRVVDLSALKANGGKLTLSLDAAAIGQLPVYDD